MSVLRVKFVKKVPSAFDPGKISYQVICRPVRQITYVLHAACICNGHSKLYRLKLLHAHSRHMLEAYFNKYFCLSGDCSFQNGYCQWTKNSSSIWQWMLGSGQSHPGHSAPMYDPNGSPTG